MSTELKTRISVDMKNAMKSGDTLTRDTLRVLMGEIDRGQLKTDEEIQPVIKKMIDNLKETNTDSSLGEIKVLEVYTPKQLTSDEINSLVIDVINTEGYDSMKSMGALMQHFKDNYPNQYDGKVLSNIVRQELNK
jgi:uncharacterized protein